MYFRYFSHKFKNTKFYQNYILKKLKKNPEYIFKVKSPSEDFLYDLIDLQPWYLIRFINIATPNHIKHAFYRDKYIYRFLPDLPHIKDELKIAVIELDYSNIIYLKNLNDEVIEAAIEINPYSIKFIQEDNIIPEEILRKAIRIDPDVIRIIKNPSEKNIKYANDLGCNKIFWGI